MISITDYIERSEKGPILKESEFEKRYIKKVQELVADFGIKYNPEEIVPNDKTVESVWNAGVDLLASVGLYNSDTRRIVELTRKEIMEITESGDKPVTFGKGPETITIKGRSPDDPTPPVFFLGPGGSLTEEYYVPITVSYAQIPQNRGVKCATLISANGIENMAGYPHELIVNAREVALTREALRLSGRSGMWIFGAGSAVTPLAVFHCFGPGMCDSTEAQVPIAFMPELKFKWDHLKLAIFAQHHGIHPMIDVNTAIGGFARNPMEGAITLIANALGNFGFSHGSTMAVWTVDMKGNWNARKKIQWTNCAAMKALDTNIGTILYGMGVSAAGLMTEMAFYEAAFYTVAHTCSGIEALWGGEVGHCMKTDHAAGIHGQIIADVGTVVAGLDRDKANELINKIYAKYENNLDNPLEGIRFNECYDTVAVRPKPEFLSMYDKVKYELGKLGVPLK